MAKKSDDWENTTNPHPGPQLTVGEGSLATFAEWFYSAPTCAIGPTELRTAIAAWLAENGQPAPAPQS